VDPAVKTTPMMLGPHESTSMNDYFMCVEFNLNWIRHD